MKYLILTLACAFSSTLLSAQTVLYVEPQAQDGGDGSVEKPYVCLDDALQHLSRLSATTDTAYIQLAAGTYYLDKTIRIEEVLPCPVVIQGDAENLPVLSGSIPLNHWEVTPEGWWKTHIDEVERYRLKIEQLYMNGTRATRARTPDKEWFMVQKSGETVHRQGAGRFPEYATQCIEVRPEDLQSLKGLSVEERSRVMVMFYHKWDNTRTYLSRVYPDEGLLYMEGEGMKPWNPIGEKSRFVLENYKGAMTIEGEWFLEPSGDLYYIPRKGEILEQATGEAPVLEQLLVIRGEVDKPVTGITFRNLSFEHTGYIMPQSGNPPMQAAAAIDATIHLDHAERILFENCQVQHIGNYAFWFDKACRDCRVEHTYLYDLGAGGIKIGEVIKPTSAEQLTRGITINNNIIRRTGRVFPCAVGVAIFHSPDNRVTHNEIADLLYSGVSVGWVWGYTPSYAVNNEIAYNHIHHIGWGELSDMGAVYTLGVSPGTRVSNNVIHHVYSYDYGGWGLYTDEGSTDIVMSNNLVYGCKNGGFHQHYGTKNEITNNIFAYSIYQQIRMTRRLDQPQSLRFTSNIVMADQGVLLYGPWDTTSVTMDRNCYWDVRTDSVPRLLDSTFKEWKKKKEPHSLWHNPQFKNAEQADFHIGNQNFLRKIGFKPFDYREAGVYGCESWKAKARMPREREELFDQIVRQRESSVPAIFKKHP